MLFDNGNGNPFVQETLPLATPNERGIAIYINDEKKVEGFDIGATAGGWLKPVDLVFNDIEPRNGVIEIRLVGQTVRGIPREAILQALEVGPGDGGAGANPKSVTREP